MKAIDRALNSGIATPFYLYDVRLLEDTLSEIRRSIGDRPVKVHYAVKANGTTGILRIISREGFGADCVSGGEIEAAVHAGFRSADIFFAGVGKTDSEIELGLRQGIGCFNVESLEELRIIAAIAESCRIKAPVALRINPDIDAHTHHYITTGLEENKFGISADDMEEGVRICMDNAWLRLRGLHFHIGSQITTMEPFKILCERINGYQERLDSMGVKLEFVNVGGGLGIDYDNPEENPIPPLQAYFDALMSHIRLREGQTLHCELGRSVVAQCGSLISRVVLVKKGKEKNFAVLDAGMNDLLRPALYGAHHKIVNLSSPDAPMEKYDVVGPVCESSDCFGIDEMLPRLRRGDYVAILSAGAYGQSMASTYNMRPLPRSFFL